MIDGKLEQSEIEAIENHAARLSISIERNLTNFQAVPQAMRTEYVNGQILYWKHLRAALKWFVATARQRKLNLPNA